jgi:hypothetical protein
MFNFIINNIGTIIVSLIILTLFIFAVIKIVKAFKKGKCIGCNGDCSKCKRK